MDKPCLTIAIPTYNRVNKLKFCIERIIQQNFVDKVEILVSDNASDDGTQKYMTSLCNHVPNIQYIRNAENVGPDKNFLNCYNKASGEYVLLLGDDDLLLPGALESIIETIQSKPVFIHLNSSYLLSDNIEDTLHSQPRFKEEGMLLYYDKNEIIDKIGIFITFMSSLVLRTDLVRKIENKEQYIGTYFLQSHITLRTMQENGIYMINTKNCIAASGNAQVGYDLYYVWFESMHRLLIDTGVKSGFDVKLLESIYYRELRTTIAQFVKNYRKSCPNESQWEKKYVFQNIRQYPELRVKYAILLYCPKMFMRIVFRMIHL